MEPQTTELVVYGACLVVSVFLAGVIIISLARALIRSCSFLQSLIEVAVWLIMAALSAFALEYIMRTQLAIDWRNYYAAQQQQSAENHALEYGKNWLYYVSNLFEQKNQ